MPKGDCFEAAYRKLRELHREGDLHAELCHGFITTPKKTFCHAWVENNGYVIDDSNDMNAVVRVEDYDKLLKPTTVIRYPHDDAVAAFLRHKHYGPWHESFDGVR